MGSGGCGGGAQRGRNGKRAEQVGGDGCDLSLTKETPENYTLLSSSVSHPLFSVTFYQVCVCVPLYSSFCRVLIPIGMWSNLQKCGRFAPQMKMISFSQLPLKQDLLVPEVQDWRRCLISQSVKCPHKSSNTEGVCECLSLWMRVNMHVGK